MKLKEGLKYFKKGDVIVYILLITAVIALFLSVLFNDGQARNGFYVTVNNQTVLKYDFLSGKAETFENQVVSVEKFGDERYKIQTENGYNLIEINRNEREVRVIEADCGLSKECTKMDLSNGIIICAPHRLTVRLTAVDGEIKVG